MSGTNLSSVRHVENQNTIHPECNTANDLVMFKRGPALCALVLLQDVKFLLNQ